MGLTTFTRGRVPQWHRGIVLFAFTEVAVWYSGFVNSDLGGGGTATWTAAGTTVCRIDPAGGGAARVVGGRIDENSTHIVTVPADAEITDRHRLTVDARGTFDVLAAHLETGPLIKRFEVIQLI